MNIMCLLIELVGQSARHEISNFCLIGHEFLSINSKSIQKQKFFLICKCGINRLFFCEYSENQVSFLIP